MADNVKQLKFDKIYFSIGAKLITIISIIVVFSLGSIIALASWLIQADLRISAEENNFETNRRCALEAESSLSNFLSSARVLIQNITAPGLQSDNAAVSTEFFFTENQQVASIFFLIPGSGDKLLLNRQFFTSREIDAELAASFFNKERAALGRAQRGETVLVNAAPVFSRPLLAIFFPWQNDGAGGVLFSSENINNNFGFGANQSYMINSGGDLLTHSDFSLVKNGTNIAQAEFVRSIMENQQRSSQQLLESDFGVFLENGKQEKKVRQFLAFSKLSTSGAVVITSIEYDKVFEGIAATTRRNIYLTIAVLSISIIFIWFFSKTISIPLKTLSAAAQQIENGNFNIDIQHKSRDEIGILSQSFNKMGSALHIFGRFTNKEIAVKAMRGEIKPGGFPKHATIFFSDIRGFTALSENFTNAYGEGASGKIVFWLNNYFTRMIECIEKTNGVVDKFIGDAVMAHWGAAYSAGSPEADAYNCVFAALMMRKALYYMNKERKEGDMSDPVINIGCGINTGIVTAGQLGSDMRMEYTVIGDPVNLASRIESLTKPLGADILISEDTWNLVGEKFITEEMPSVTVKGKEKPVRLFAVVNFTGIDIGPQSMKQVRKLLGIKPPDISKADVNAEEKKYKIDGK